MPRYSSCNAAYRGKDKPTNVLSFPMMQPDLLDAIDIGDDGETLLGDIILAHETCAREAEEKGIEPCRSHHPSDHPRHASSRSATTMRTMPRREAMEAIETRAWRRWASLIHMPGSSCPTTQQGPDQDHGRDSRTGRREDSAKEGDSSSEGGRIWRGLKALLFGTEEGRASARRLEDVIEQYDGEDAPKPIEGDLVPVERQMLKNMLHFSQHTADDVAVPRADIIAISQDATFRRTEGAFRRVRAQPHPRL